MSSSKPAIRLMPSALCRCSIAISPAPARRRGRPPPMVATPAAPISPPPPAEPFADLPNVLALAAQANIAIKITGACTLSHDPFPYPDIWDNLRRIFDAFGLD